MQFCFFGFANFFYGYCIYEIANETADGIGQVPTGNHRDSKYRSDKKSDLTTIINEIKERSTIQIWFYQKQRLYKTYLQD